MKCKICSSGASLFSQATILNKYLVSYYKCSECGFVHTEEPYWFDEAYSQAINSSDVGLVNRNIMFSKVASALILAFFNSNGRFLDYGGGYGLFVRIMRDRGLDFYWLDEFCSNIFAKGLEHDIMRGDAYELLTAFEVFEHLKDPYGDISKMLRFSKNVLFTTELLPAHIPEPGSWWYYGLEHGQHISFYTWRSLSVIAKKFNLNLYSNGRSWHLLTDKTISPCLFNMLTRYRIAILLHPFFRKRSLLPDDYKKSIEMMVSCRKCQ